jgi:N-acetylmuramic acid 6-phosphate etherase
MVMDATGADEQEAATLLEKYGSVRLAVDHYLQEK